MENESTLNLLRQASTAALRNWSPLDAPPRGGKSAFAHQHLQVGLSLYTQGNIPEALWEFFEAAGDEPANPLSHYLSGLALQALGLGDEATDEWRKVLTLTQT
jgi:Flp pilus assembly protein TadD